MKLQVRSVGGRSLGLYVDVQHIPRAGEEIVLFASNRVRRVRCKVRGVITTARITPLSDHAYVSDLVLEVEEIE